MSIPDKHDPRAFNHYAKMADDGTVAAIVEIAAGFIPQDIEAVYADVTVQVAAKARTLVIAPDVLARVATLTATKAALAAEREKAADAVSDAQVDPIVP